MAATSQGWNWQLTSAPLKYYFYLILFGLKAIRISVYSRDMSPASVFTRHLTHWQFMARSQISSSFQISRWLLSLSTSVQCWPCVSAAGTILLLWLCSHCVVTILCGQAVIVQQVVRKESAIQTHYILHCIFCNLAKQEKMWVNPSKPDLLWE